MLLTCPNRRPGMSALQAVILLGAGFLVVWGLMAVWEGVSDTATKNAQLTVRGQYLRPAGAPDTGPPADDTGARPPTPTVVEPPETKFKTPSYGLLTDDEIGAKQGDIDWWWGATAAVLPGGVGTGTVYSAGFGEVKTKSEDFAKSEGGTPGETNALQHAYWQAQLAYHYGSDQAKAIGDQHETLQQYGNANRRADTTADLWNNQVGRQIGEQVRKERDGPPGQVPGFDADARMRELIIDAYRNNRLDLNGGAGGGAGVGPGKGAGGLRKRGIEPRAK